MKIRFNCPSCSKAYAVAPDLAGKKAKCKQCGHTIVVPANPVSDPAQQLDDDFIPVQSSPDQDVVPSAPSFNPGPQVPPATFEATPQPVQPQIVEPQIVEPQIVQPQPVQPQPATNPFGAETNTMTPTGAAEQIPSFPEPHGGFLMGDTVASNPGKLKVSKLRYARSYPKWFMIWHTLAIASVALVFLHSWWWTPLALFFILCVWFYWYRIKMQFQEGCANPAIVISVNPPLIAAYTDLTKGDYALPIIKVCDQPIHTMSTGKPTPGQKLATVAFYEDRFDEGPHWSTFDPKPAACVSSNQMKLQKMLESFEAEDWQFLDQGMAQIPKPIQPGHYRIYSAEDFQRTGLTSQEDIYGRVMHYQENTKDAKLTRDLDEDLQKAVAAYTNNMPLRDIWCVMVSMSLSKLNKQGMALTAHGIFYYFDETGKGAIRWQDIVGATCSNDGMEIMLRNKQRLLIPDRHFASDVFQLLDVTLEVIAGRTL